MESTAGLTTKLAERLNRLKTSAVAAIAATAPVEATARAGDALRIELNGVHNEERVFVRAGS